MIGGFVEDGRHSPRIPLVSRRRRGIGISATDLGSCHETFLPEPGQDSGDAGVGKATTGAFAHLGGLQRNVTRPENREDFEFEFTIGSLDHASRLSGVNLALLHDVVDLPKRAPVTTSMQNKRGTFALVFFATVFAILLAAGRPASAHNSQESSVPADGEVLATSPSEWRVTFASSVPLDSATGQLVLFDSSRVDLTAPVHGETDRTIVFALPPNLAGAVTARWRLVGVDGHVISGRVSFTVASAATPVEQLAPAGSNIAISETAERGTPEPVRYSLRLLNYVFALAVGGLMFVDSYVARGTTRLPLSRRLVTIGSAGLVAIPALQGLIYTADLRNTSVFSAPSGIFEALGTTPGAMYFTRALLAGVIAFLLNQGVRQDAAESTRQDEVRSILMATGGFMYLVTLSYVGHSRSQRLPWIGIPVDMVHTAAAAVWLGGLAILVFVVIPGTPTEQGVRAFLRFSPAARLAVATLAVTGVIQTARLHGDLSSLFGSTHGRLLLVKIALVVGMLRFAAINQRVLRDAVRHTQGAQTQQRRRLTQASVIEALIGLGVVAVTAALVSASLDGAS